VSNPEIIEKWRKEYIDKIMTANGFKQNYLSQQDGIFVNDCIESGWQGFLMARESVEIELLQSFTKTGAHMINQIVGHIEAQCR